MSDRKVNRDTIFIKVTTLDNETYFVSAQPKDLVSYVKSWVSAVTGVQTEDMKLYID